jgi:alginate O-acetyltransferase complex protein AlgI
MLFSSALFLFGFVPIFYAVYFAVRPGLQNLVLVTASLSFYAWAEPRFIFWALASALLDYTLGWPIHRSSRPRLRQWCLTLGVVANVGLLAWFKYANFFADTLSVVFRAAGGQNIALEKIILPIAISFIVFEKITYLVDLYRRDGQPAANLLTYLLYVFYFPKLLAGPIIRYRDIAPQLVARGVAFEDLQVGTVRFFWGLGKKVLLADPVGHLANQIFALSANDLDGRTAWLGVVCFTAQIYFDFSGYSDMAIGLSRTLGFRLNENFRMPYTATSFTDFWRRWHISLSTWIREYLYSPLGGNRVPTRRAYFNLCLCFLLSGLWHGAAWNFIIWGMFHGVMLIGDRAFWLRWQRHLPRLVSVALTFFLVMVSWVIFRATSLGQMSLFLRRMFWPWDGPHPNLIWCSPDVVFALGAGAVISFLPLAAAAPRWLAAYRAWKWRPESELAGALTLLVLASSKIATDTFNAFLYFRF